MKEDFGNAVSGEGLIISIPILLLQQKLIYVVLLISLFNECARTFSPLGCLLGQKERKEKWPLWLFLHQVFPSLILRVASPSSPRFDSHI